jgi:hypothetical protein
MIMEGKDRDSMLMQEYLQLQKVVEDYDQRALTIKAWSVTFSAAALGTAYVQNEPLLLLIAAISAFVFWIVEALWKTNQQAYYARVWEIEVHYQNEGADQIRDIRPFAIGLSYDKSFKELGAYSRVWTVMRWPHVALPHIVVIFAGLLLLGAALFSGDPRLLGAPQNVHSATPPPSATPR